jgi:hypothetical protein
MKLPSIPILVAAILAVAAFPQRTMAEDSAVRAPTFLPFDFYSRHREALELSEDQVREMQRISEGMRESARKLEEDRRERTKALQEAMDRSPVDSDKAMERFRAVLKVEDEMKVLQFRSEIALRNTLSTEQLGKLKSLAAKEGVLRGGAALAKLEARLQELRAAIRKRAGGEPPREIVEQLRRIEQAAKDGRLGDAKDQLEQLLRRFSDELQPSSTAAAGRSDDSQVNADERKHSLKEKLAQRINEISEAAKHTDNPELREQLQDALRGLRDAAASDNDEATEKIMRSIEPALQKATRRNKE